MYGLTLVQGPSPEPVTLQQVKLHCRVDESDQDAELNLLITAARRLFEKETGLCLGRQTWALTLDHFPNHFGVPASGYREIFDSVGIRLPKSPVSAVAAITYVDTAGATQTVDPASYQVDATTLPARIVPAYGTVWPVARYQPAAVTVTFAAGDEAVDRDLVAGMLLLIGHWNEHREAVLEGVYQEVPLAVRSILALNWDGAYRAQA